MAITASVWKTTKKTMRRFESSNNFWRLSHFSGLPGRCFWGISAGPETFTSSVAFSFFSVSQISLDSRSLWRQHTVDDFEESQ